jgi:hypothetical protein
LKQAPNVTCDAISLQTPSVDYSKLFNVDYLGNIIGLSVTAGRIPVVAPTTAFATSITITPTNQYDIYPVGTLTNNTTCTVNNGSYDGQKIELVFPQNSTGSWTITFAGNVEYGSTVTAPGSADAANKTSYYLMRWAAALSTPKWAILSVVQGY